MNQLDSMLLWIRHMAARIAQFVRMLTGPEAGLQVALVAAVAISGADAFTSGAWPAWSLFGGLLLVFIMATAVTLDAMMQRVDHGRTRAAMIKVNTTKPTGAPRVAEVSCRHGDPHRFVYGPTGWEHAGPAVENRPIQEEVSTS